MHKVKSHKEKLHNVKPHNVKPHNVRATKILGVSAQDIPHRMNFSIRQIFKYLNSLHSTYVIKFCKRQFLVINLYFSIWNRTVSHKTMFTVSHFTLSCRDFLWCTKLSKLCFIIIGLVTYTKLILYVKYVTEIVAKNLFCCEYFP